MNLKSRGLQGLYKDSMGDYHPTQNGESNGQEHGKGRGNGKYFPTTRIEVVQSNDVKLQ